MDAMVLFKVTVLLSLTLLVACGFRRAPAVTRHRLWTVAFVSILALPLIASALPALHVPVPPGWRTIVADPLQTAGLQQERNDPPVHQERLSTLVQGKNVDHETPSSTPSPAEHLPAWPGVLAILWTLGTLVALSGLFVSLFRAHRLAAEAVELDDAAWRNAAGKIGGRLGVQRQMRLVVSPEVGTPMAGGVWRPVIFLPASIRTWSEERRDVVLAHEIAHVAASDPLRHLLARIAVALYWFHPFIWIAARRAAAAREQACDEAVLALGTLPSVYARTLLDLADSMAPSRRRVATLSMVERSQLEARLMTILRSETLHEGKRRFVMPAIALALLTLPLAAAQPAVMSKAPVQAPIMSQTSSAAPAQAAADRDSACWSELSTGPSFSGSRSTRNVGGREVVDEQIGTRGNDRVIQTRVGDLRLCLVAEGAGGPGNSGRPSQWISQAARFVMEAQRGTAVQRLEVVRQGGSARTSWRIGAAERAVDAAAQQWRERMLAALDTTWELATLRGEVSSLQGQISSVRGQESSLRGEISSLQGEVSTLRGRASSLQGEESTLRGRISMIRGHLSSLQGAISTERGAISGVNASRYGATPAERAQIENRIKRHEAEVARLEREIRDYDPEAKIAAVEKEIVALRSSSRAASIESEINAFDLRGKVAAVEQRIAALDVQGKVAAIQRQITSLDADRRSRELESRRESELKQLEAAIGAIR